MAKDIPSKKAAQPVPKSGLKPGLKTAATERSLRSRFRTLSTADSRLLKPGPKPVISPQSKWPGWLIAYYYAAKGMAKSPQVALFIVLLYMVAGIFATSTPISQTAPIREILEDTLRDASYYSVVNLIVMLALPLYGLSIADRKEVTLGTIFRPNGRRYLYVLGATVLSAMAVVASGILLLIPVIWLTPWFFFGIYIVADKGLNPLAALRYSKQLASQHKLKVWGLLAGTIVLSATAALFSDIPRIGVALSTLLSSTFSVLFAGASAILYRWLQHQPTE